MSYVKYIRRKVTHAICNRPFSIQFLTELKKILFCGRKTKIKCFDIQKGAFWPSVGPLILAQVPALLSREMKFFIPPLYAGAIVNSFVYGRGLLQT